MAGKKNDYKTMMAELQALLARMQAEELEVDDAITEYERGQKLITELQNYLVVAENTVDQRKLQSRDEAE